MKTFKFVFSVLSIAVLFASCDKTTPEKEIVDNFAAEVEGIFVGTIVSDAATVIDTYEVVVEIVDNDRIRVSAEHIPAFETTLTLQENPDGQYYQSPWQVVDQYVTTYWLESQEFVMYVADGEVNFIGDRKE
ncbi:MAG: hypothetical protein AAF806_24925 [Bacteroidota bacterium]